MDRIISNPLSKWFGSYLVSGFFLLLVPVLLTPQSAQTKSYDLGTLSDTYEFRALEVRDLQDLSNDSEAEVTWGEIEYDGSGNWSTDADTFNSSADSSAENRTGTYEVVGGETFVLEDNSPGVPDVNLAVSPDSDVTIGTKGDTNGAAVNELRLGTRRHTSLKQTESGTIAGGTYQLAQLRFLNFESSGKQAQVFSGTTAFTPGGKAPVVFSQFLSDGSRRTFSTPPADYLIDEGDTVAINTSATSLAFTPDTGVFVGRNIGSSPLFNGVLMGTLKPDTKPKVSDLSGTFQVRGFELRDYEDIKGQQESFSIWGEMVFDGSGNWQGQGIRKYSSSNSFVRSDLSGTYAVSSSDTLYRFIVQPDTQGIPPYVLSLEPDTDVFVAFQADTNTSGVNFAQQSLLAGVRSVSGTGGGSGGTSSNPDSGCLIERFNVNNSNLKRLRNLRDRLLSSKVGRFLTNLYYQF